MSAAQGGLLFGLPVVLDTDSEDINVGDRVLLTYQGAELAIVEINSKCARQLSLSPQLVTVLARLTAMDLPVPSIKNCAMPGRWVPNKPVEALHCYGTTSLEHPAVQMIAMERGKFYLGALP